MITNNTSRDKCAKNGATPSVKLHRETFRTSRLLDFCSRDGVTVADNGPGIPEKTVADVLDFSVRVSSREASVSPTRGAQGNALKTIIAMPFVLSEGSGEQFGRANVLAQGIRHDISIRVDRIRMGTAFGQS